MSHSEKKAAVDVCFDSDRTGEDLAELHDALEAYHTALRNASTAFNEGIAKLKRGSRVKRRHIRTAA